MSHQRGSTLKRMRTFAAPDDDDDDDEFGAVPDPEVARIMVALNRIIVRSRRAVALRQIVRGQPVPLPIKPSRIELLVLTALVQMYGPLLFGTDFRPVLDQFAECGAVVLLQQVVFGVPTGTGIDDNELSQAGRVAARLRDARPMFEALCRKFPGAFLADARTLLKRFTTPPDLPPNSTRN